MKTGTRVMYSARWLRSCGIYTGETPFMRGVVTSYGYLSDKCICHIDWDDGTQSSVWSENLIRESGYEVN